MLQSCSADVLFILGTQYLHLGVLRLHMGEVCSSILIINNTWGLGRGTLGGSRQRGGQLSSEALRTEQSDIHFWNKSLAFISLACCPCSSIELLVGMSIGTVWCLPSGHQMFWQSLVWILHCAFLMSMLTHTSPHTQT